MENLGLTIPEIRERLEWVTELTGLGHLLEKPPYEISGGQKQRVALAAVLAMMPKVLILDEPTSRVRIFEVLAKLKAEQNNTIIVIEHSLEHLVPLADRMILLVNGEAVLHEETQMFFQQTELLLENSVYPPGALRFFHELSQKGHFRGDYPLTVEDASALLKASVKR